MSNLDEILTRHYQRRLGRRGRRQLVLRIMTNGRTQEDVVLRQAWIANDAGIHSTVVVEPGSTLSGTHVQISECVGEIELNVEVGIPGSQRCFSVGSPFATFVFGSEFTYEDFRFFLPPGGLEVDADKRPHWVVKYPSMQARHTVNALLASPVTTEWFSGSESRPFRIVSSAHFRDVAGVIMPSLMTARRSDTIENGEQSCMLLADVEVEL